jgi:Na+-transporting methylmalonyl-CoA/oxaloacetate decarboxylase beta subunit
MKKVIVVLTIICVFITFISISLEFLLPLYLSHKFNIDRKDAASIGIIGGADGPTAIYLAGTSKHMITIIFAVLAVLGVIYLLIVK